MNRFRPLILAVIVVMTGLLSYGLWTLPSPKPSDAEGFSASRAVKDIEVISEHHHSVAHPEERAQVRSYLVDRLIGLGADTVMQFRYDSLTGPENKHVKYTFDAVDVLAEFSPIDQVGEPAYVMLMAHYDSRYSQPMPKDTVWSYGAADDGYGISVILETVSQALKQREHWKQGIKVLFTDAEEVGMMGMKSIWENDREVFDNVGFIINVEARGPWGPALLFETSPGNEKVMDLYASAAGYPYTYSLTTVVYRFMPNFTDFKVVKDEIPGMNFSTVDDINHYHTDLDNFSNVSARSVQHYGAQILPVTMEYLRSEKYSGKDSLKSDKDATFFTIPALGIIKFSRAGYMILNLIIFGCFLLLFGLEGVRGRLKAFKVFKSSLTVLMTAVVVCVLGELMAFICAKAAGAVFKPFGIIQGVTFDNVAMIIFMVLLALSVVFVYIANRRKSIRMVSGSMRASASVSAAGRHAFNSLYSAMALMLVLSVVLLIAVGENFMFLIPLFAGTFAMIMYHMTSFRLWLPVAVAFILLHAFSFLYALAMALTIGAFGAVAMIAFLDLMVLVPMIDLYLMPSRK